MAQVTPDPKTRSWIDDDLDYLFREWGDLPAVVQEWDEWDELWRLTFVVEWPLKVDRMNRLAYWFKQDAMTTRQRERYDTLQHIMAHYAPDLERLLADDAPVPPHLLCQ